MSDFFLDDDTSEDQGFEGYVVNTVDPGPWLLIGTILVSVGLYAMLPCILQIWPIPKRNKHLELSQQRQVHRENRQVNHTCHNDDDDDDDDDRSEVVIEFYPACEDSSTSQQHDEEERIINTRDEHDKPGKRTHDKQTHDKQPPHLSSCCSIYTSILSNAYNNVLEIAEWNHESQRLYKLALAFGSEAIVVGVLENARVAILGQLVGTPALSAYVLVSLLVGLTSDVVGGFYFSLATLLSHSIGANHNDMTGQYVQLAIWLFILFSVPFILMWMFVMEETLVFLGLDAATALMGQEFARTFVMTKLIKGINKCFREMFATSGHEVTSSILGVVEEVVATSAMLIYALHWDEPTLQTIGYIFMVVAEMGLFSVLLVVAWTGWFKQYYRGLFHKLALTNWVALKMMIRTATPIACGYLLAYGEWEVLAFFAAFLGPAELVAWSLLGTVWDVLEDVTQSVADAAEVRCATLLGAGKPWQARASAYKSIMIAFVFSMSLTSVIFICGNDLPKWLTTDETLQVLVAQLIPLFGVGNITLTMGTMAWTLVGSQGRYRLATAIGVAGSWCITIPLSVVLTIVLKVNLEGQTAAVVIGYMVSGVVTIVILLRSDWQALSEAVIEYNKQHDIELSDDEDDDSCSDDEHDDASSCSSSS
ncbi:hypothetical protein MPSEU_000201200 [Mayamaea pseudoterrestris]|nr:hypothetical protein MPSEU_000201200 [Mayamaea pseudoterrestris]